MKNLDLNELLSSSLKNVASNYKSDGPPWFMPSQSVFNMQDCASICNSLASQMMQYGIFQGKTIHKFSIYLPEDKYNLSNLDEVIKNIQNEDRSLKLIYRSESACIFISADHLLCYDFNLDKIEVFSFTGTKLSSLKESLKILGKK